MQADLLCQACRRDLATETANDTDDEEPYRLCSSCLRRLEAHALRPIEWYHLMARYGNDRHLLHDDFYDESGKATQPGMTVDSALLFSAPTLHDVVNDTGRLVEYSMTRWWLDTETRDALQSHPNQAVLGFVEEWVASGSTHAFRRCLDLCADVLGPTAGELVLSLQARAIAQYSLDQWAAAAAHCLDPQNGINLTFAALEAQTPASPWPLIWFRSPLALGWIERNVPSREVMGSWGGVAAYSNLSWERTNGWLKKGRPLSLVAIDALKTCTLEPFSDHAMRLRGLQPRIAGLPQDASDVIAELRKHKAADSWPRVDQTCKLIIDNVGELYRRNPPVPSH